MPIVRKRRIVYVALVILHILGASFAPKASALQSPPQDVVILVDCSESASPYLPPIIEIINRFVTGAQYGDSFACYQFSNNPFFFAGGRIEKQGDIAKLKSQIRQLRPVGKYTNYSSAIGRAMEDIESSHQNQPDNDKILIMITDGRRHQEDIQSEKKALHQLRLKYASLEAGKDYYFYCFYIGEQTETDMESYLRAAGAHFVRWPEDIKWLNRLTLTDIRIMQDSIFLGEVPNIPTQKSFFIDFHPRRSSEQISMLELGINAPFAKKTLDKFFDVDPRRFICQRKPWSEKFRMEIRGFTKGKYSGAFSFQPTDPRILLLSPRSIDFSFSVLEPLNVNIPTPLEFGPTDIRGEYKETRSFFILPSQTDFPDDPSAISVAADIELPEGVQLEISKDSRERQLVINIAVSRTESLSKNMLGEYQGTIRLDSKSGWTFLTSEIPVLVRVTRAGLDLQKVFFYMSIAGGCVLALVLLLLASSRARKTIRDYLYQKTTPAGKLIITRDPTRGLAKSINLERISEKQKAKDLIVGMGEEADVELPHRSMMDKLYRFSGTRAKDEVKTFAEAIEGTDEVIINNSSRTGKTQLVHMDTVKLGAFEFRFEMPTPLRQAVLYFLNGDVWEGWLTDWNTEAEGLRILRRDTLPDKQESFVRFYELKAVAFVRDFDGELSKRLLSLKVPRWGHRMRLIFADQEELTGYILDWKDPGDKFYFFPDKMGDNIMFFLIEKSTLKELAVLEEDSRGAERARRLLARLLDQMQDKFKVDFI